jgi:hypothetical protein
MKHIIERYLPFPLLMWRAMTQPFWEVLAWLVDLLIRIKLRQVEIIEVRNYKLKRTNNMHIKIGTKMELSEELKNVAVLYSQTINELWNLILMAQASITKESHYFWDIIRKEYPELQNFEMSYDNDTKTIVVIREKTRNQTAESERSQLPSPLKG